MVEPDVASMRPRPQRPLGPRQRNPPPPVAITPSGDDRRAIRHDVFRVLIRGVAVRLCASGATDIEAMTSLDVVGRNIVRATLGVPVFAVQHLFRCRRIERSERVVATPTWAPPEETSTGLADDVQRRSDGCGPLVVRRYAAVIAEPIVTDLLARFVAHPNSFVPRHVAGFKHNGSDARHLRVGRRVLVEIPGPWNGPVQVVETIDSSITFATLVGHMEAGHIRFETTTSEPHTISFVITSWARAGDPAFEVAHLRARIAAEAQLAMWIHVCDRARRISRGRQHHPYTATTEIVANSDIDC